MPSQSLGAAESPVNQAFERKTAILAKIGGGDRQSDRIEKIQCCEAKFGSTRGTGNELAQDGQIVAEDLAGEVLGANRHFGLAD